MTHFAPGCWSRGGISSAVVLATAVAHAQQPPPGPVVPAPPAAETPALDTEAGAPTSPGPVEPTSVPTSEAALTGSEDTGSPQAARAPESQAATPIPTSEMALPGADAEPADADAEALAIEQELLQGDDTAHAEHAIDFYGFADFTYTRDFNKTALGHDTFAVGHLNLYMAADLGDSFKSLIEARYTYLPNGSGGIGSERVDTSADDYTNVARPVRWGASYSSALGSSTALIRC